MGARGIVGAIRNASVFRGLTHETRGLAKDSTLLAVGKAATTIGMIAQVSLIVHGLGLRSYGVYALTAAFVAIVDKFFDVDVSKAVIAFGSRYMSTDRRRAVGIVQVGYLVDFLSGVLGFAVVAALAPVAGPWLVGSQGAALFLLYGVTLLVSTVDATSVAVLQLLDRYRLIAAFVILRELTRVILVTVGIIAFDSLIAVVALLVVHEALTALMAVGLASRAFRVSSRGLRLRDPELATVRDLRRPMFSMIFQTNLVTYGRLVEVQVPTLLLGIFRGTLEVGLFKIGMAGATAVGQLSTPAWNAVLPRLSRLWAQRRADEIRRLLKQGTLISAVVMVLAGGLAIAFRVPILRIFGGDEATAAATVMALGVVAQVVTGVLFWNDSLLYAAGRAKLVTMIYLPIVGFMIVLVLILGYQWGAVGAAVAILTANLLINGGWTLAALRVLRAGTDAAETRRANQALGESQPIPERSNSP